MIIYRVFQGLLLGAIFVLAGLVDLYLLLGIVAVFIANLYVRNKYMYRRFNPWKDKRRNFDTLIIGQRYNISKLNPAIGISLEEIIWGRSLYASFHILRAYFSLLKMNGRVYIVYNEKCLKEFSPIDMSIVNHPVTLSIMGCRCCGLKRKFPIIFLLLYWIEKVCYKIIIPRKDFEASLVSQIKEFCEERQIHVEFIKI